MRGLLTPQRSCKILEDAKRLADRLVREKTKFALWGAGNTGHRTLEFFGDNYNGVIQPEVIIDNNPSLWGKNGVISPESFFDGKEIPPLIIVSVYVFDQVLEQIQSYGYQGEIQYVNLMAFNEANDVWQLYEDHLDRIEGVYDLLGDEKSKETLIGFLNYIRTLDHDWLRKVNRPSNEKLVDSRLLKLNEAENFADVGAFTGDTIDEFLQVVNRRYQSIVAFEPDKQNFAVLKENLKDMPNVQLFCMAAGKENGTGGLRSGMSESSVITDDGTEQVTIKTLDSLEAMRSCTFLKISANGQELAVLEGAQGLIQEKRIKISTYISGRLLWEIPLFLHALVPEYRFYLRHYGMGRQAMICYAIVD